MIDRMSSDADRPVLPERLLASRALVLLPTAPLDKLIAPLEVLIQEGLDVVSLRPDAEVSADTLRSTFGRRIMVGTHDLTTTEHAEWAIAQQAAFALTMGSPQLGELLAAAGLPAAPAAFTPTEVAAAWQTRPAAVQVVPATALSTSYAAQLAALVPQASLIARETDSSHEIKSWLNAGAIACCLGTRLLGDALSGGDLGSLRSRARMLADAVRSPAA